MNGADGYVLNIIILGVYGIVMTYMVVQRNIRLHDLEIENRWLRSFHYVRKHHRQRDGLCAVIDLHTRRLEKECEYEQNKNRNRYENDESR